MDCSGFIEAIQTNIPVVYVKFGDGEFYAIKQYPGSNCDRTPYTPRLGNSLKISFTYFLTLPHVTIGRWHQPPVTDYLISLSSSGHVPWGDYCIFMFQSVSEFNHKCLPLYRSIRYATQQKIYVCNEFLVERSKTLFNIDNHIIIHPSNWFETTFDSTFKQICDTVRVPTNVIFLISAGMGGKYLIFKLQREFPNSIIMDIGSAFDQICSLRQTRDYHKITSAEIEDIYRAMLT